MGGSALYQSPSVGDPSVKHMISHESAFLKGDNYGFGKRADDGTRTRYLELGKLALYQVSYVRAGRAF